MSIRSWLLSLLLPVLSIIIITGIMFVPDDFNIESLFFFMFALIFGYILCGIAPITVIVKSKTDISKYLSGKIILFTGLIVVYVILLALNLYFALIYVMPALILIAEGVFAAVIKTDLKTKLCVFLSSPSFIYVGFMIDLMCALTSPD